MSTRIKNNLWQVGGRGLTDPADAAVYLVRFGDKAALIDAGSGRDHPQLRKNISECVAANVQLEYLLVLRSRSKSTNSPAFLLMERFLWNFY